MTPRQRFGVWVVAVVAALAAPLWLHAGVPNPAAFAAACGIVGLSLILLLLATTPANAIRLPRGASIVTIGLGAALLPALAAAPTWAVLSLGAAALALAVLTSTRKARFGPHLPWALTLLLWHPSLWLMSWLQQNDEQGYGILFWMPVFFAGNALGAVTAFSSGTNEPRDSRRLALFWTLAAILTLMQTWRFGD